MTPPFDTCLNIQRWLKSLERRRRILRCVEASARHTVALLLTISLLMLADRYVILSVSVRVVAAIAVVLVAAAGVVLTVRDLLRPIHTLEAAHAIEGHRPLLDERLLTLANLSVGVNATVEMQLRAQVADSISRHPIRVAWPVRRLAVTFVIAVTLLALFVVSARRNILSRELHRVLLPWKPLPATLAPMLRLSASPSAVHPNDQPVIVEAYLAHAGDLDTVTLHVIDTNGETEIAMTSLGQNRFTRTLTSLLQSADVYATAGDLRSRTARIHVLTATSQARPKLPATKPSRLPLTPDAGI